MRGWLRAVLRELRHGVCVGGFVGMAVVLALLLWTDSGAWGTDWNALGSRIRENQLLLGPLAVVLGAWQGGRARRSEVGELLASTRRSVLARQSAEIVALGLALFGGVLVALASAGWTIVVVGGYGTWVAVAYVVAVLPALLANVALGHLVGSLLSWRVVAPLVGVLTYAVMGFAFWRNDKRPLLTGGGYLGGLDLARFDTDAWAWGILIGAAATIALLGLASVERRPAGTTSWVVVAAAGAAAVVLAAPPALATMDAGRSDYPQVAHADVVCTQDDGPKVCVLRQAQHQLDEATAEARTMLKQLRGIPGAPTWAGPYRSGDDVHRLNVYTTPSTPWGEPSDLSNDYVSFYNVFAPVECTFDPRTHRLPGGPENTAFSGGDLVAQWLDGTFGAEPTGAGEGLAGRFAASSDAQKRAYAGLMLKAARTCDPVAARAASAALGKV